MEASIFNIYSGQEGHFSSDEFCIFWMWLETGHIQTLKTKEGRSGVCMPWREISIHFFFYLKNTNRTTFNILIAGLE